MQDFRSIYTGGSKNVEGQFGQSQNPIKNFINHFLTGNPRAREKITAYRQNNPNDVPKEIMDQVWEATNQQFADMKLDHAEIDRMMHEEWMAEEARIAELQKMEQFHMENAWREEQANIERQKIIEQANQWGEEYADQELNDEFENAYKESEEYVKSLQPPIDEQTAIKSAADDMIETMESQEDPRFKNSNFLAFLKKLKTGELKIEGNVLTQHDPSEIAQQKDFEDAWKEEEHKAEQKMFDHAWAHEETKQEETDKMFDDVFKKLNDPDQQKQIEKELEEEYKKMLSEFGANPEEMFNDMWQAQQEKEEQELYGEISNNYDFAENNPYALEKQPLQTALSLSNKGRTKEAILALETHLQQHPNDVTSWRFLGRLHQENDQDRKAVTCLMKAMQIDPKDLDTLLALGVSCTNILDEIHAMNHMKNWMLNNEKYKDIPLDPNLINEQALTGELTVEQIKDINTKLIDLFELARQKNPNDPDLLTSMAVLFFIARDYKSSVNLFNEALKHDPSNYSLWNKLGATLAHLGRTEEAIEAYSRALEVKPNYVRCWVNLGIAHAFKGEFDDAIRLYLNALTMNPTAKHVWGYLQTCFISTQRWDLATKVAQEDVNLFRDEFDILTIDELTGPDVEYKEINEKFLIKKDTDSWVKEFA